MKIFITGGTGFIGQHLIQMLSQDPCELIVLSRKQQPTFWCGSKYINLVKGDLTKPETYKDELLKCEVIINIAAEIRDENQMEAINIAGVKELAKLAAENDIKIIHISSVGVVGSQYNNNNFIVNESTKCIPLNKYEKTKLESEKILLEASSKNNFNLIILRPTNVFGDFDSKMFLLNFLSHIKNKKLFLIVKNSKVNYVYVKDVTNAICYFITNNHKEKIFNIGKSINLSEFINIACDLIKIKPRIVLFPNVLLKAIKMLNYFGIQGLKNKLNIISNKVEYDDKKLENILNYSFGIKEGLKRTISYYKSIGKI